MAGALERLAVLASHFPLSSSSSSDVRQRQQPGERAAGDVVQDTSCPVVIIGGVVLDVQARPTTVDLQRGGSVPGSVRQVPGGVGRNIAEAISRLMPQTQPAPMFISLVGDDTAGSFLANALRTLRLDLTCLLTEAGMPTPCVTVVFDRTGEVAACVADVASLEARLTAPRLRECAGHIQRAGLLVGEANLSEEALHAACSMAAAARVPVLLEPVSVPKSARLACVLQYATFVTPNAAELIAMADAVRQRAGQPLLPRPNLDMVHGAAATHDSGTGSSSSVPAPIVSGPGASSSGRAHAGVVSSGGADASLLVALLQQLAAFAAVLLGAGAQHVVLTLGSLGAALISRHLLAAGEGASRASSSSSPGSSSSACSTACWDQGGRERGAGSSSREGTAASVEVVHMRALPAEVVSVSGAGDTLVAGMVGALMRQQTPLEALAVGMAAAKQAVLSNSNVPESLQYDALAADAQMALHTARCMLLPLPLS